jgi:hypothetical protein
MNDGHWEQYSLETPKTEEMVGVVMKSVRRGDGGSDELVFEAVDGRKWKFYHEPDCCEHVSIEDITGNLDDLVGAPLTVARDDSNDPTFDHSPPQGEYGPPDSFTWTFYTFATVKGWVTVRWYGESNGYYSERVDFVRWKEGSE